MIRQLITTAALLGLAAVAHSDLLDGHVVKLSNHHGTSPDRGTYVGPIEIEANAEVTSFGYSGFLDIEISDNSIRLIARIDQPFSYWEIIRIDDSRATIAAFENISVNKETDWAGFTRARITYDEDYIVINVGSLRAREGQVISLDINSAETVPD